MHVVQVSLGKMLLLCAAIAGGVMAFGLLLHQNVDHVREEQRRAGASPAR